MLSCHFTNSHVCTNNNDSVVRYQTYQPKHSCLQILLVTTEIDKGNQLFWVCWDMDPVFIFILLQTLHCNLLKIFIKAHNLLSNTRSSPILLFVREVKDMFSCKTPTVVHDWLSKNSNERTFPRVNISNHSDSSVIFWSLMALVVHVY